MEIDDCLKCYSKTCQLLIRQVIINIKQIIINPLPTTTRQSSSSSSLDHSSSSKHQISIKYCCFYDASFNHKLIVVVEIVVFTMNFDDYSSPTSTPSTTTNIILSEYNQLSSIPSSLFLSSIMNPSLDDSLIANNQNKMSNIAESKISDSSAEYYSSTSPTVYIDSTTTMTPPLSWVTKIISNNDSKSLQCSMLMFQQQQQHQSSNANNELDHIFGNSSSSSSSPTSSFNEKLDQFTQQLSNQTQSLLLNGTWLDNMAGLSSSSSSSTSSANNNNNIMNQNQSSIQQPYCDTAWDGFYCWPMTTSGTILMRSCQDIFNSVGELPKDQIDDQSFNNAFAYRICDHNGTWINNWTNYTECLLLIANNESDVDDSKHRLIRQLVIIIMFSCSILSLILLSITFFIFTYYRSLTSCRLRVHRNLVLALIIHSFLLLLIASPHLFNPDESLSSYWEIEWLCKSILTLKLYSTLASINWMFVEGFQLHSRVTVSIFRKDAPFKIYHLLGWGIPLVLVSIWALQMSLTMDTVCWNGYAHSVYIWIIVGPMILALLVNCIFLVNIIRVLLTKLRLTVTIEIKQIRKAIKATALLFPLLGISHLLFCINPDDDGRLEDAYLIFNAFLQSSQGIFVSVLYCFMDSDVQQVLKITYQRARFKNGSFKRGFSRSRTTIRNNNSRFDESDATLQSKRSHKSIFHGTRSASMKNPSVHRNHQQQHQIDMQLTGSNHHSGNCCFQLTPTNTAAAHNNNNDNNNSRIFRKHHHSQKVRAPPSQTSTTTNFQDYKNDNELFTGCQIDQPTTPNHHQHLQLPVNHGKTTTTAGSLCIMYNSNGEMVRFKPKSSKNNSPQNSKS